MMIHHWIMCSFTGTVIHCLQYCPSGIKKEQQEPLRMFKSRMLSQSFKSILELTIDKVGVNLGR